MDLYNLLAKQYSAVFPLDLERVEFIESFFKRERSNILDIGCATGDLAIELAKRGYSVTGIDLNGKMVSIGKRKTEQLNIPVDFQKMNMLSIDELESGSFQGILCFGNTLPHLKSDHEISGFFRKSFNLLDDSGLMLLQILNYDKILSDKNIKFPIIETEELIFKRSYDFLADNAINFKILLKEKLTNRSLSASTVLLPITREMLKDISSRVGFSTLEAYSDYKKTVSNMKEFATIYVLKK